MRKTINKAKYLLVLIVMLLARNYTFGGTPITITMDDITFDSGHLLTLGDGTPNNIYKSEYFAYYLNDNNTIKNNLTIRLYSNYNEPVILIVTANTNSFFGFGNICYFDDNFTFSPYGESEYLTPDGAVPSTISKHDFNWQWTITVIPKCNTSQYDACTHTFNTHHCCYVLWDTPLYPMDEPWISVLDFACDDILKGSVYEYENQVIEDLTSKLYSSKARYDGTEDHYTTGSNTNFNLSLLLYNWYRSNTIYMDCRDFANLLHVLANLLGVNCEYKVIPMNCYHNYLKPANWPGDGISPPGFWYYHQIAWYDYDSMVVDASTMIDVDSDPTGSDPYNHIWELAKGNMSLSFYLDQLTESNVSVSQTGKCSPY